MKNTFDSIDQVNNLREIQARCEVTTKIRALGLLGQAWMGSLIFFLAIYKSGQIITTSLFSLTGIMFFIGESSQKGLISGQ